MAGKKFKKEKITKLCGGNGCGCPCINETDLNATKIADDHNGQIQLNDAECRLLGIHLMKRFSLTAADLA